MPEILPPAHERLLQPKSLGEVWRSLKPAQRGAVIAFSAALVFSVFMFALSQFFQIRGVQSMGLSLLFLGIAFICAALLLWGFVRATGHPRWIALIGTIVLLLAVTALHLSFPIPKLATATPEGAAKQTPLITLKIHPSAFPVSVPPRSTLYILPLHPFQGFTESQSHLHEYDNSCPNDQFWPSASEIQSRPLNAYEEVRAVDVTNHGPGAMESGRIVFQVRYNQSFAGGCTAPPQGSPVQTDVISIPTLDQGKTFEFVSVNQTAGCSWLLPPDSMTVKMAADENAKDIPIKLEPISVPNWISTPFGPTTVKWEGVPARSPGYGIVRSGAACELPKAEPGLQVTYRGKPLEGQVIVTTTRYSTVDGKPQPNAGEYFSLPQFQIKNLNPKTSGDISAAVYLNKKWFQSINWEVTQSDEAGFPSASLMRGAYTPKLNPEQTMTTPAFDASTTQPWPASEIVAARLKVFYGAEKPAVVNFRVRKIGTR